MSEPIYCIGRGSLIRVEQAIVIRRFDRSAPVFDPKTIVRGRELDTAIVAASKYKSCYTITTHRRIRSNGSEPVCCGVQLCSVLVD